jgi:type VI secretion system protein ImpJ
MFLRPQHFQATDRYWSGRVATSSQWDNHYNYGLRRVKIAPEALANHQIEVSSCQARLQDGTIVSFDVGEDPDRVDFKQEAVTFDEALDASGTLRVFLAVPRRRLGQPNVSNKGSAASERYIEAKLIVPDESSGGGDQEIAFSDLNVKIMLSTQDLAGYEVVPLAQIKRSTDEAGTPMIDEDYIPPVLSVDAWPPLGRDIVRAICDFLGQQLDRISTEVVNRGVGISASDPLEVDLIFRLMQLNESYAILRILAFAEGVHPFHAYCELCRIVGKLAIFQTEKRVQDPPLYDHDDLAKCFFWVKEQILAAFELGGPVYEQEYFTGLGPGMHVSIKPKWLFDDWQWYVGVARGSLTEEECCKLLEPGFLNWKMGSASRVDEYWTKGVAGLELRAVARPPSVLPSKSGWTYFEVNRSHPAFRSVKAERSLAVRFSDKYIQNLDSLQGKRDLQVDMNRKTVNLQFALFALNMRSSQ